MTPVTKGRLQGVALALVAAGVIGTSVDFGEHVAVPALMSHAHAAMTEAVGARAPAVGSLPNFSAIVQQSGPAVVNISVTQDRAKVLAQEGPQIAPDDPMFEFFRHFGIPMPQGKIPTHGQGSGFIVSQDGYILTNAHVVDEASEVTVKLTDRREFKAKVVGVDPLTDVAVIKIDAHDLPVVTIGRPEGLNVGAWVVAIGSPFGFENSVTAGIVSAKSRTLPNDSRVPFIQTDVAVNPGNSGGPLLDLNGNVVGINSQIYSRTGGYMGLSFAIPIDIAMKVKDELVKYGKVSHGRLGVSIQEVNQALADSFGLDSPHGALVSSVEPDSPAAKAGLKTGDVILSMDGKPIERIGDLTARVAARKPGDHSTLGIWRKGDEQSVDVTIGEMQSEKVALAGKGGSEHAKLGVVVRPLASDERKAAKVDGGLVVEDVNGAAERAGLQPGDIILSANGDPVKSVEALRAKVAKAKKNVALLVQRDGNRLFIPVQVG
jgi:serine protease Do